MTIPRNSATIPVPTARDDVPATNHHSIPPKIEIQLRAEREKLQAEGAMHSRQQLERYYDAFRRRFGPEVLRSLDGEALLDLMHLHGNKDSLVYWLEFKNDDEFPGIFGSIAGGSALKFGVFRRIETGVWATAGTSEKLQDISVEQAIEIARRHRDQLLAAVTAVGNISGTTDADYLALQQELQRVAPDLEDTAWGHKYLSLIFPDVLDDYHVAHLQRYHLIRVLQLPPQNADGFSEGRYVCAGRFVELARELDLPLVTTATLFNRRNGRLHNYWRIGTTDSDRERRKYWPMMRDGAVVAIGWSDIGDLAQLAAGPNARAEITQLLTKHYPGVPQTIGRAASQISNFLAKIEVGDRVLAADGMNALGVGEVTGPYRFVPDSPFAHQRPVEWCSIEEWKTIDAEALRTTVGSIKDYRNQVEIERHILEDADNVQVAVAAYQKDPAGSAGSVAVTETACIRYAGRGPLPRLKGLVAGAVQQVLERKGQAILYGPPGTGKTYWGLRTARDLATLRAFGREFQHADNDQRARIVGDGKSANTLVRTCSFHPEYGYEDFIEGFRPHGNASGALGFKLVPGVFRRLCADAEGSPELDFYLVIDEINRGDIPRIFGELLTLLERDKRGEPVRLGVSGDVFTVPKNVFVIGTMNTADRSIALLDVALRRRFGFVELMPDYEVLGKATVSGLTLRSWLANLNKRIRQSGGGDARNRQIGHAFLLDGVNPISTAEQFAAVVRDDIVPLLEEYCYDDFNLLQQLLGKSLVDIEGQRVRRELFDIGREEDLVTALNNPEIATDFASVTAEEPENESGESEDESPEVSQ